MKLSRVFSILLVVLALLVLAVFLYFVFGKRETKKETESETKQETTTPTTTPASKVLNVVTHLSDDRVHLLKSGLGESYLLDARSKTNSYTVNGVTVSVVSGDVTNEPGYTKYTHTLPKPFKGNKLVFDADASHDFFEDPVSSLTTYYWFNSLLLLTFKTQTEGESPVLKYYHFTVHLSNNALKWDRFDRDPTTELDPSVLAAKLNELNLALGNVVVLNLDEYLEGATGTYSTTLNMVSSKFSLVKRSSSSTGFVKLTHKLLQDLDNGPTKPFKLWRLNVSGTDLADLSLTPRPVVSVSVYWWYNMPLLAEFDLHGGDREYLTYNVETNNWEKENVDKLRAKLFLLKNKLGEPLTVELSKTGKTDQTYTTNGVLVRVSPGATPSKDVNKFTHRFTTGNSHFVGTFMNAGTAQMGLPVMRLVEVSVYYMSGVPLLLKLNMATAGSLATKFRYYTSNGYGLWSQVTLTQDLSNTDSILKKLKEDNQKLGQTNDKYVLDAMMRSNYMSNGKLVELTNEKMSDMQGYYVYKHQAFNGTPFKFEKFTVSGKEVAVSVSVSTVTGVSYAKVYMFLNTPLLLQLHVPSGMTPSEGQPELGNDTFFSFNATTTEWTRAEGDLSTVEKLKLHLSDLRGTMSSVTLNLGNSSGEYRSGVVNVQVVDATPYNNDPPTSFTKRLHVLNPPFPVDVFKHFDFDLVLVKKIDNSGYAKPSKDPLLPKNYVVSKAEVYFFGEVPLYLVVYGTHGSPLRFANEFRGTLWREDEKYKSMSLPDLLTALSYELRMAARFDVCKDAPGSTVVTYKLRHLGSNKTTDVTVTKSQGPDGVTLLTHKVPESVTLKFTTLTCGQHALTGLGMDEVSKVFVYRKYRAPLFLKMNSDPRFFALSGDGGLTRFLPPEGATDLTPDQLNAKVTELSTRVGKVYDLDLMAKTEYTLLDTQFTVTETSVGNFKKRLHALKTTGRTPKPFTLRSLVHNTKEAVLFPTGLRVSWVAVFFKGDNPFYLQLKETTAPVQVDSATPTPPAPKGSEVPAAVPGPPGGAPGASPGPSAPVGNPPTGQNVPAVSPVPESSQPAPTGPAPAGSPVPSGPPAPEPTVSALSGGVPDAPGAPRAPVGPEGGAGLPGLPPPVQQPQGTPEGVPERGSTASDFDDDRGSVDVLERDELQETPEDPGKHHNYVHDGVLWLSDGVYEKFVEEEMSDRLQVLKDGLGNEFSLDLSETVDNPLFDVDITDFELVRGFKKHTYDPKPLDYPMLLKDLKVGSTELNLPFENKHLKLFSAYSFRKNFLFFHSVSHDDKDEFFKTNFSGSFEKVEFEVFNKDVLKKELESLKKRLGNMVSLEMANKSSYPYHTYTVKVVKQRQPVDDFDKYLHDLTEDSVSVPFKLVSAKNNGHVTNVPSLEDLVYFAYVYMSGDEPLLLELLTSLPERSDYHYYYFGNNLGNWELLENPSLGRLDTTKLKEVLKASKSKLSKTYKVDLGRKFSYKLTNEVNKHFLLDTTVTEDARETVGFSLYTHNFTLARVPGGKPTAEEPTASALGATTALTTDQTQVSQPTPVAAGGGVASVPSSVVPTTDNAQPSQESASQPRAATLTTYQTLKANALRGVNNMAPNLPVGSRFVLEGTALKGLGADTLMKANVYWYHDRVPALVHLHNGVDNKYYMRKGKGWMLSKKVELPLARSDLALLLNEAREHLVKAVELDLDKSSDFDTHVKYMSNGLTVKVVPSYSFEDGFKGFTHFSATHYEKSLKVSKLTLWGDEVYSDLPDGYVKTATVLTDSDLLPLAVELEWKVSNNMSFVKKYNYYKNTGSTWAPHVTDNASEKMVDDSLLAMLKEVKEALGERVILYLNKRESYGKTPVVTVTKAPESRPESWNGFHKVSHTYTNTTARVVMLKMGDRVLRTLHVATYVKRVDTYWYRSALLLVRLTVAGNTPAGTAGTPASPDTYLYFKNDYKEDLMPVEAPQGELSVTLPHALLEQTAVQFRDEYELDVADKTLKNAVGFTKFLPALHTVDTSVPEGYARYNLYVLDHVEGLRLGKLLYHGRDFSTENFSMPEGRVHSVYAFSPVGHFSPFFLELHVRGAGGLTLYYYHLNQYGDWMKLDTGGRRLTHDEFYTKLSLLSTKFGNVTVVDVSKTEGSYYGLNKMDVSKFEFPGARGYKKYLHRSHDGAPFTVSKFVNKGVVLENLPVLKVSHVSVYTTQDNRLMLLELKVGGRYRFFSSNANGEWNEERLTSGDLRAALNTVYDEHTEVARVTGDLVTLRLQTGFVREYVLTEGTVESYDGAVAVIEDEPEKERSPPPERLLPEEPETPEPTVQPPASAAVKKVLPPMQALKRSHVLNPETYVPNDKLAYNYPSHGKTVHALRRDDVFRGYNVTVHRLADLEPFTVRSLVYMGKQYDLGFGKDKFLSSTVFAFMNKPLVLKMVHLTGVERYYSFDFNTQEWKLFSPGDLEQQLDDFNYAQNKSLVLDLAKDTDYTVNSNELVVTKVTFASVYTRVATRLKTAEQHWRNQLEKGKARKKREEEKEKLKAEMDKKKSMVDTLKEEAENMKQLLETFRTTWKALKPEEAGEFAKLEEKVKSYEDLKAEVALLEQKVEASRGSGSDDFTELSKELEEKKKQLETKKTEMEQALKAASYPTDSDLDAKDVPNAQELEKALLNLDKTLLAYKQQLDIVTRVNELVKKFETYKTTIKEINSYTAQRTNNIINQLNSMKTSANLNEEGLSVSSEQTKLLKSYFDALPKDVQEERDKNLSDINVAFEVLKVFFNLSKNLQSVRVLEEKSKQLSKKPEEATQFSDKVKAVLEVANHFDKNLRFENQLKAVEAKMKKVEEMLQLTQLLNTSLKAVVNVDANLTNKLNLLKGALKNVTTFNEAYNLSKKYYDSFISGVDPNSKLVFPSVDWAELVFTQFKEAFSGVNSLPDSPEPLKKFKETAKTVLSMENPFTGLKTDLSALKFDLPELSQDVKQKLKTLEDELVKVQLLPSLAETLKTDLDALDLTGTTETDLTNKVNNLKSSLSDQFLTDLKTAVDSTNKLKNDLKEALDLNSTEFTYASNKLTTANTALNSVKSALESLGPLDQSSSDLHKKLKDTVDKAAKLKESTDPFNSLKLAVNAFNESVKHELKTASAYRLRGISLAYHKLLLELKSEATRTLEKAQDMVNDLESGKKALEKLEESKSVADKFKTAYDALNGLNPESLNTTNSAVLVNAVTKLKDALANVTKLKESYITFNIFKANLPAENRLENVVTAANKFNELFEASADLKLKVAKVEEYKPGDPTANYEAVKEAAKALKAQASKLNLGQNVDSVKQAVTVTHETLKQNAPELMKSGLILGKHKHKKFLPKISDAELSYSYAKNRHDRYDVNPEGQDSDDDPSTLKSIMFALGGLRHAGKNVSHAGLPLGSHVHTLNAFYVPNFKNPMMLQFKYKGSEDEDEVEEQMLTAPPPSDALTDSQATASSVGPGSPQTAQSGTVQQVERLLEQAVSHSPQTVATESAPVLPTKKESGTRNDETRPVPESGPDPEVKRFTYPGRFFVFDVDGTWKPFVPGRRGSLQRKLEELMVTHALGVNLDLGVVPGARREATHTVNSETMKVRRVLYNSGYNMNRQTGQQLQGATAGAHVVNLSDYVASVSFFPPLHYEWYVHQKPPKTLTPPPTTPPVQPTTGTAPSTSPTSPSVTGASAASPQPSTSATPPPQSVPLQQSTAAAVDPLPEFNLQRLSLNGVPLKLTEAASAVLSGVNSVSVVLNNLGTPLLLFAYKTEKHEAVLQHTYKVLALNGEVYDLDYSFGNYHNLLYKVEHTDYSWSSDASFDEFNKFVEKKLTELNSRLEPFYVVDLAASTHYMRGKVVVNVESSEAFGVKHVSYTPGLADLGNEPLSVTVPAFVVQRVFLGETVFKGFKLPFRDALHVSAFYAPVHYPLRDSQTATTTEQLPLLLEFSYRNKFNRLEHYYYRYLGADRFELLTTTKLRFTASEVADVVKAVAYENLRTGRFNLATLSLDLSVKGSHFTPGHRLTVEKLVKKALLPGQDPVNPTVPDNYVVYKYSLGDNDPGFTLATLSFGGFWKFNLQLHNYKVFYTYVRETDSVPVLVAASYTETPSTLKKHMWVGYNGTATEAVLTTSPPDPLSKTPLHLKTVEDELSRLTGTVDFLLQPRAFELSPLEAGQTVKLSPVSGVRGFPTLTPLGADTSRSTPRTAQQSVTPASTRTVKPAQATMPVQQAQQSPTQLPVPNQPSPVTTSSPAVVPAEHPPAQPASGQAQSQHGHQL